jgi:hypothetical protein
MDIRESSLVNAEKVIKLEHQLKVLNVLSSFFEGVDERFRIAEQESFTKGKKYKAIGSSLYFASAFLLVGAVAVVASKSPEDIAPVPLLAVVLGQFGLVTSMVGFMTRDIGKSLQEGIKRNEIEKPTLKTSRNKPK